MTMPYPIELALFALAGALGFAMYTAATVLL